MGKGRLFWIILVIVLILLAVLYGFAYRKKFDDVAVNDVASGEDGIFGANGEIESGTNDSDVVINDVGGGSSGGGSSGGSGGGSGSAGDTNTSDGGIVAPPVIPNIE